MMKKLVLDPGHGGSDPGAVARTGLKECDVALMYCKAIEREIHLIAPGEFDIEFTHSGEGKSLDDRCVMANAFGADAFVSIHCNAAENTEARGFEVFTTRGNTGADAIATNLYNRVRNEFSNGLKPRHDWSDGDPDREANFYVLAHTVMPAVLFELGFITNDWDRNFITDPGVIVRYTSALASGIVASV